MLRIGSEPRYTGADQKRAISFAIACPWLRPAFAAGARVSGARGLQTDSTLRGTVRLNQIGFAAGAP